MAERNRGCDAMIVDSASPMLPHVPPDVWFYDFGDNVGHLSRQGRDGWGRAFCRGLTEAMERDYDWVIHIECDSLCNLDLMREVENLELSSEVAVTIPLSSWPGQIETGLMFFSVDWLRGSRFVQRYDWASHTRYPEPEKVVKEMCGSDLTLMNWRGMRDDFHELNEDNLSEYRLDWLTHAPLRVMERFAGAPATI